MVSRNPTLRGGQREFPPNLKSVQDDSLKKFFLNSHIN